MRLGARLARRRWDDEIRHFVSGYIEEAEVAEVGPRVREELDVGIDAIRTGMRRHDRAIDHRRENEKRDQAALVSVLRITNRCSSRPTSTSDAARPSSEPTR